MLHISYIAALHVKHIINTCNIADKKHCYKVAKHSEFLEYLISNSLLTEYQYGFLPNRSTQESVFEVTKSMYSAINNRKIMGLIFLDVAKAFNSIHHGRLYKKLKCIGCSERFITWLKSYLDRTQIVSLTNRNSNEMSIYSGIAQGTVLGPLIFIVYINDVVREITHCKISMFVDDCILYHIGNSFEIMYHKLQTDLDNFIRWCCLNGLKINIGKTKAMISSTTNRLKNLKETRNFKIEGREILYVNQYNYLGLILDNVMC